MDKNKYTELCKNKHVKKRFAFPPTLDDLWDWLIELTEVLLPDNQLNELSKFYLWWLDKHRDIRDIHEALLIYLMEIQKKEQK